MLWLEALMMDFLDFLFILAFFACCYGMIALFDWLNKEK